MVVVWRHIKIQSQPRWQGQEKGRAGGNLQATKAPVTKG